MNSPDKRGKRVPKNEEVEEFEVDVPIHRPRVERDDQEEYEEWHKERGERGRKRRSHRDHEHHRKDEDEI